MARRISDMVVVITGASSGIGRATALVFARRGATVVLAARDPDGLCAAAVDCENAGGEGLAVPTDVTDEIAVLNLARQAAEAFGRIDVWVNNAGVMAMGRFEDTPPAVFRQVIETNLFGTVYGARAALPYFHEQGRGVLINVSSLDGKAGLPYASAYVASKFAVRGFSESLRAELRGTGIDVCTVYPASIDTPLFQHTADYFGRAVKPMSPIYQPEEVAETIVRLAEHPRPEAVVGRMAHAMLALPRAISHRVSDRIFKRQVEREHFQDRPVLPSDGNLFEPMPHYQVIHGGWSDRQSTAGSSIAPTLAVAMPAAIVAGAMFLSARSINQRSRQRRMRPNAPPSTSSPPQGIAAAVTAPATGPAPG